MKSTFSRMAVVALTMWLGLAAGPAKADLSAAGGGLAVYDAEANLSWLANANLAASNTFDVSGINSNGTMTWDTAEAWIGAMNTANYLGYHDWRLPTTLQPDATCSIQSGGVSYGANCTGSEMGHLFYNELGGVAGSSILTTHNADLALFNNVQSNYYWSGTAYGTGDALSFALYNGGQDVYSKPTPLFALAVRPGQVAAVPEPETYAMLLGGLGLLGFVARRRNNFIA